MCATGYHHNCSVATHELGHMVHVMYTKQSHWI